MTFDEIIKLAGAIITSLGGSAIVIVAVSKWCGNLLAEKLLANIKHKYEKEIEKYKLQLRDMSTEFNVLIEHSMQIASKQYDMEIEIYINIWKTFHELSECQNYIYHFENPTQADPVDYLELLQFQRKDLKIKLEAFRKQIDSSAPFYQENAYNLLCKIEQKYTELLKIIEASVKLEGMSKENKKIVEKIFSEIKNDKDKLTEIIREYLLKLKSIPNVRHFTK